MLPSPMNCYGLRFLALCKCDWLTDSSYSAQLPFSRYRYLKKWGLHVELLTMLLGPWDLAAVLRQVSLLPSWQLLQLVPRRFDSFLQTDSEALSPSAPRSSHWCQLALRRTYVHNKFSHNPSCLQCEDKPYIRFDAICQNSPNYNFFSLK